MNAGVHHESRRAPDLITEHPKTLVWRFVHPHFLTQLLAIKRPTFAVRGNVIESPNERFGMLGYQIWRAARLVVDTGVHSKGWTRDQALKYMHDYTALPEHEIETEVDRYIAWPAQALSYYTGEPAILRAREKAEKTRGAQ